MATKAPTSNGVVLARSCAAPFMVVLDRCEVATRTLAHTRFYDAGRRHWRPTVFDNAARVARVQEDPPMKIANTTVLVTGANRGIGQALVEEALSRGATRVYAGTRRPLAHPDGRVTPLTLDVTNTTQLQAAVEHVESLDLLFNNAGVARSDDLRDRAALDWHLAVNLFGTHGVTQAFLPLLARSRGAIVNLLSTAALAAFPLLPAYSIAEAATFSLTQSLRALLAARGVRVHAVLAGAVDTDMTRGFDRPKASVESVARAILDGVENGEEEILPDPRSASLAQSWRSGAAKALERQYAALVEPGSLEA